MTSVRRASIYGRVVSNWQASERQTIALKEIARRRGWDIAEVYVDAAISDIHDKTKSPAFDRMLKDAARGKFDLVMASTIAQMGHSLHHLIATIENHRAAGVDLYLNQEGIDTTMPSGKLLFQLTNAFAEFEQSRRRRPKRTPSKPEGKRSRATIDTRTEWAICQALAAGQGVLQTATQFGVGSGTVQRIRARMRPD